MEKPAGNPTTNRQLFQAIEDGDLKEVRESIRRGASAVKGLLNGHRPLHWAVLKGKWLIVKELLNEGAEINALFVTEQPHHEKKGYTTLHFAAEAEFTGDCNKILEELLRRGGDVSARNTIKRTPLHIAATCYDRGRLVEVNRHFASDKFFDVGRVHLLLTHGSDIHARDYKDQTPYQLAEEVPNYYIMKRLEEAEQLSQKPITLQPALKPAPSNAGRYVPARTPISDLIGTIQKGTIVDVRQLLNSGVSPDTSDSHGTPALIIAALHQNSRYALSLVETLLARGATPSLEFLNRLNERQEIAAIIIDRARQFGMTVIEPRWLTEWRLVQKQKIITAKSNIQP